MSAPSGTSWGSIVGNYGKLGIYVSTSSTETTTNVTVEIWFASKYSVSDTNNTLYFDNLASSGSASTSKGSVSISTTVDSGSGWSSSNQKKLKTYTYSYTRGTSTVTRYLYAKLAGIDRVGGIMYASKTFTVPALATYTITYNANGGSGAPASQTKYYGKNVVLSNTKPTRTGYIFQGWGINTSSVSYASGATYSANTSTTLYAIWKAMTYTVTYNANGGTGAPANQTKIYGVNLTLSSTKPTRTNYNFKGWGTSSSSTTVAYASGGTYTANTAVTLYAIWELAYTKPRINGFTAVRCISDGSVSVDGTYAKISFSWATDKTVSSVKMEWKSSNDSTWTEATVSATGTSGTVSQIIGNGAIDTETSYTVRVTVTDASGSNQASATIGSTAYPIDILVGGKGVAIGKVAETENCFDVNMKAKFRNMAESVYGSCAFQQVHPTTGKRIGFGIGDDGNSRGIWDNVQGKWLLMADANNNIHIKCSGNTEIVLDPNGAMYVRRTDDTAGGSLWFGKHLAGIYEEANAAYGSVNFRYQTSAGSSWSYTSIASIMSTLSGKLDKSASNKTLWSGCYYMLSSQTIPLSEPISQQPNGIVLVWSEYTNGSDSRSNIHCDFIPRSCVSKYSGCSFSSSWTFMKGDYHISKYCYISDSAITGHDSNQLSYSPSTSAIKITNNKAVLTTVIGV